MLRSGIRIRQILVGPVWLLLLTLSMGGCSLLRRPPPPVDRSQDDRIRREVVARLAGEPALRGREVRVDVDGAVVTLYGAVHGIDSWNCAIHNAQMVEGVRTVVDFLMIERGPSATACSLGSAR